MDESPRTPRLYFTWYRCVSDGRDHAVTDDAFARGVEAQQGRYQALCGHEVLIDSCLNPPGRACRCCSALIRLHLTTVHVEPPPEASRWRRLISAFRTPAVPQPRPPQRARHNPKRDGRTPLPAGTGDPQTTPVPVGHHPRGGTR